MDAGWAGGGLPEEALMRIGYFDCFSGASGDMILAACVDAGVDVGLLEEALAGLDVRGYCIDVHPVRLHGLAAVRFHVRLDPDADRPHRHLSDIRGLLAGAHLPERVRDRADAIFTRLAEAEAAVHGTEVENVHFHEVGAVDALVDIVGASLAVEQLGLDRIIVSPVPVGSGTVTCEHGTMPVPAPATAELLKGYPLADCPEPGELTTPTGAAVLTALADGFGPPPAMTLERVGVGAGQREGGTRANILRLLVGRSSEPTSAESDEILVFQAGLDDTTGELIGHACQKLFDAGAYDVYTTPIYMKKGRPGVELTVLAPLGLRDAVEQVLFAETTTFGVRVQTVQRSKLARVHETVETSFGPVRVKVGRRAGRLVRVCPEFEDCRRLAETSGRPISEVMEATRRAWEDRCGS
jgi:hypothetical protein